MNFVQRVKEILSRPRQIITKGVHVQANHSVQWHPEGRQLARRTLPASTSRESTCMPVSAQCVFRRTRCAASEIRNAATATRRWSRNHVCSCAAWIFARDMASVQTALRSAGHSRTRTPAARAARGIQARSRTNGAVGRSQSGQSRRDICHAGRMAVGAAWDQDACPQYPPRLANMPSKKNARIRQTCPTWAETCYEQLREQALDARLSSRGIGLNILLQQGMATWLGIIDAQPATNTSEPHTSQQNGVVPHTTTNWISALASLAQGEVQRG